MMTSVDDVAEAALALPASGRVLLVEQLLASLSGQMSTELEAGHLAEIRERRASVRSGKSKLIEGQDAFRKARSALLK